LVIVASREKTCEKVKVTDSMEAAVSHIWNAYNAQMAWLEPIELFKCSALWPLSDEGSRSGAQQCDTAVDGEEADDSAVSRPVRVMICLRFQATKIVVL
jgi:hypothetical protein